MKKGLVKQQVAPKISEVETVSNLAQEINYRAFTIQEINTLLAATANLNLAFEETLNSAGQVVVSQTQCREEE
jgi:hypothetical protein